MEVHSMPRVTTNFEFVEMEISSPYKPEQNQRRILYLLTNWFFCQSLTQKMLVAHWDPDASTLLPLLKVALLLGRFLDIYNRIPASMQWIGAVVRPCCSNFILVLLMSRRP